MKFLLFKVATAFFFKQDVFRNRLNLENSVDSDMHISKSQVTKITAAGTEVEYNVYFHTHFPRYKLRTLAKKSELCDTVEQITGYLDVDDDKHFFFWFFESRSKPSTDPLVLWLNGGPGCSSLTGLLMELGPCKPTKGGNDTVTNKYSWNNNANVIFLDQPVNVGFSYTGGKSPTTSDDAAEDVLAFLHLFISTYSKYSKLPFHVTGESYAGHYIPAIGHAILESNKLVEKEIISLSKINFVSMAIGNGLTDPLIQYQYYPEMAADKKYGPILAESAINTMRSKYKSCKSMISACYKSKTPFSCVPASFYCNSAMIQPFQSTGLNIYDIRKTCDPSNPLCYDILNDIEAYLNTPSVQDALGVDVQYEGCKRDINLNFLLAGDWMHPYVSYVGPILEAGIKVLIYAGDADFICNYLGNKAWALALEWSGAEKFNSAKDVKWVSNLTGREAGEFRMHKNFAYLRVYEAGHMVPYDQPEHSVEFINMWLSGGHENP